MMQAHAGHNADADRLQGSSSASSGHESSAVPPGRANHGKWVHIRAVVNLSEEFRRGWPTMLYDLAHNSLTIMERRRPDDILEGVDPMQVLKILGDPESENASLYLYYRTPEEAGLGCNWLSHSYGVHAGYGDLEELTKADIIDQDDLPKSCEVLYDLDHPDRLTTRRRTEDECLQGEPLNKRHKPSV